MNSNGNLRDLNAELLLREGQEYQEHLAFAKALEAYRRAAAIDSENASVHFNMAMVLAKLGRWCEAAKAYLETIRLRPNDTQAHLNLGFVYYEMGLDMQAQEAFGRARDLGGLAKPAGKMPF